MSRIAVDVVLLPPEVIIDRAININRRFFRSSEESIKLGKKKCIPHITLAMGCIDIKKLNEVKNILKVITQDNNFFKLKILSGLTRKACFEIERDGEIYAFHKVAMNRLKPYFSYEVSSRMFKKSAGENINNITLRYVRYFRKRSAFTNFLPHITLGSGKTPQIISKIKFTPLQGRVVRDFTPRRGTERQEATVARPWSFTSRKVALCHLGNFCTCRKILASYTLGSNVKKDY